MSCAAGGRPQQVHSSIVVEAPYIPHPILVPNHKKTHILDASIHKCLFSSVQSMHVQTDRNRHTFMKTVVLYIWQVTGWRAKFEDPPNPYGSVYISFITLLQTWDTVPNPELTQTQTLKLKKVLCYWVEFLGAKSQASLLPRGPAFHLAVVTLQVKKKVIMEYN